MRAAPVFASLALVVATAIAGYTWYRMLRYAPATEPRHVAWLDARDRPIAAGDRWHGCDETMDMHLDRGFVDDAGRLVIKCTTPPGSDDREAFAWIDPVAGFGKLAWPFPHELPHLWTLAVVPLAHGRVGVVYHVGTTKESAATFVLAAGVMASEGWELPPRRIGAGVVLGAAAVDGALEVAFGAFQGPVQVARLEADVTRVRDLPQPHFEACDVCSSFQGAIYAGRERGWAAITSTRDVGDASPVRFVPEHGDVVVGPSIPVLGNQLDMLAAGMVEAPPGMSLGEPGWVLHADLTATPREAAPMNRTWPVIERDGQMTRAYIVDGAQVETFHDGARAMALYVSPGDDAFIAGPSADTMRPFARPRCTPTSSAARGCAARPRVARWCRPTGRTPSSTPGSAAPIRGRRATS